MARDFSLAKCAVLFVIYSIQYTSRNIVQYCAGTCNSVYKRNKGNDYHCSEQLLILLFLVDDHRKQEYSHEREEVGEQAIEFHLFQSFKPNDDFS